MKTTFCLLALMIFAPASAHAATKCYSPIEMQAEKVLRLHSELMVITVTCKKGSMGEDLVRAYTGFTQGNIGLLRESEAAMTSYYKKAYGGKGVDRLDTLRTQLANEYGQEIADMSAPAFCARKRDRVLALAHASSAVLSGEIVHISGRSYDPPCTAPTKVAGKAVKKGR